MLAAAGDPDRIKPVAAVPAEVKPHEASPVYNLRPEELASITKDMDPFVVARIAREAGIPYSWLAGQRVGFNTPSPAQVGKFVEMLERDSSPRLAGDTDILDVTSLDTNAKPVSSRYRDAKGRIPGAKVPSRTVVPLYRDSKGQVLHVGGQLDSMFSRLAEIDGTLATAEKLEHMKGGYSGGVVNMNDVAPVAYGFDTREYVNPIEAAARIAAMEAGVAPEMLDKVVAKVVENRTSELQEERRILNRGIDVIKASNPEAYKAVSEKWNAPHAGGTLYDHMVARHAGADPGKLQGSFAGAWQNAVDRSEKGIRRFLKPLTDSKVLRYTAPGTYLAAKAAPHVPGTALAAVSPFTESFDAAQAAGLRQTVNAAAGNRHGNSGNDAAAFTNLLLTGKTGENFFSSSPAAAASPKALAGLLEMYGTTYTPGVLGGILNAGGKATAWGAGKIYKPAGDLIRTSGRAAKGAFLDANAAGGKIIGEAMASGASKLMGANAASSAYRAARQTANIVGKANPFSWAPKSTAGRAGFGLAMMAPAVVAESGNNSKSLKEEAVRQADAAASADASGKPVSSTGTAARLQNIKNQLEDTERRLGLQEGTVSGKGTFTNFTKPVLESAQQSYDERVAQQARNQGGKPASLLGNPFVWLAGGGALLGGGLLLKAYLDKRTRKARKEDGKPNPVHKKVVAPKVVRSQPLPSYGYTQEQPLDIGYNEGDDPFDMYTGDYYY